MSYLNKTFLCVKTYFENNHDIKKSFLVDGPILSALWIVADAFVNYYIADTENLNYINYLKLSIKELPQMYLALSLGYASYAIIEKKNKLEEKLKEQDIIDVEYEILSK